jgi:hypothetical protein
MRWVDLVHLLKTESSTIIHHTTQQQFTSQVDKGKKGLVYMHSIKLSQVWLLGAKPEKNIFTSTYLMQLNK